MKALSLPTSGRKAELISRLEECPNAADVMKAQNMCNNRFVLTKIGKDAIKNLPKYITKNLEFEDKCLDLIHKEDFNSAYKEVCLRESQKRGPRGIGIDWQKELSQGLSSNKLKIFQYFWKADISNDFKGQTEETVSDIKACIILGNLLGCEVVKIVYAIMRRNPTVKKDNILVQTVQKYQFALMDLEQMKVLYDLSH